MTKRGSPCKYPNETPEQHKGTIKRVSGKAMIYCEQCDKHFKMRYNKMDAVQLQSYFLNTRNETAVPVKSYGNNMRPRQRVVRGTREEKFPVIWLQQAEARARCLPREPAMGNYL